MPDEAGCDLAVTLFDASSMPNVVGCDETPLSTTLAVVLTVRSHFPLRVRFSPQYRNVQRAV